MSLHPRRSRWSLILLGTASTLVLAGCSAAADDDPSNPSEPVQFTLSFAVANTEESPYEAMANAYMDEFSDVTITLNPQPFDRYGETVRTQLQGGNASDVIQTTPGRGQPQSVVPLAEAGLILPLSSAPVGTDEELFGLDGDIFGQPVDLSVTGILYASASAEAAGIDAPSDESELLAACRAAAAEGKSFFALAGAVPSNPGLMALSISATRVYADEPDWNDLRAADSVSFADTPGWRDTLQTVLDLHEGGCFQPGAEGGGFDAITGGLVQATSLAAFVPGSNDLAAAAPDAGIQVRAFPPADTADPFLFASPISSLSVTSASENQEAAAAFLAWLAEPAQAQRFAELSGTLPVTGLDGVDLAGTMYEPVADLIADGAYTALPRASWPNARVYEALSEGTQGLLTGQRTIDDVLSALDEAWAD